MRKKIIMHIDANSAYLSWTAADRLQCGDSLDLRTVPSVVGGNQEERHGIVLAKSIPAKAFKIQTGETLYSARMKCPSLIVAAPNYPLYMQCSQALGDLLRVYSTCVEQYSVDEYFMDYSASQKVFGDPVETAYKIKDRIRKELGFTVNVGVSVNKLLAKMGSELEKPDKVHTLWPEEVSEKMWPLSVEELFFVGRATSKKLRDRGINTIGEIAQVDPAWLQHFLKSHGLMIWNYANGIDSSPVRIDRHPIVKSLGNSTTTSFDIEDRQTAHLVLLSLVETVAARLRAAGYLAQLVSISFRTDEFYGYSRQRKIYCAIDSTNLIHRYACSLFDELWHGELVRQIGVSVGQLCSNKNWQPSLFDPASEKVRCVDQVVDLVRSKFGSDAICRASFVHGGIRSMIGGTGDISEYPMMSSLL